MTVSGVDRHLCRVSSLAVDALTSQGPYARTDAGYVAPHGSARHSLEKLICLLF